MAGNAENIDDVDRPQKGSFLVLEAGNGCTESHVLPTEETRKLGEDSLRICNVHIDSSTEVIRTQLDPNAPGAIDDRSLTLADFLESFDF